MTFIKITEASVEGVDAGARIQNFKRYFFGKKYFSNVSIPILKGINFACGKGERVGFIGNNGSGKSSLLKVIANIYPLKSGSIEVEGEVTPLIEMGLGFDDEMSGRQNIKLALIYNRMLHKYSKDLEAKIIEFSELKDKIDRPLKLYSSGMVARLAFSISILQEPDILLLDEVFAVGDSGFVRKAREAMREKFFSVPVAILVSHQQELIKDFCNRCILLKDGVIVADGTPDKVLNIYNSS